MSLGTVSASIVTGGAQLAASGADLAKTIIGLDVCTDATPAVLLHPSSANGLRSGLGGGPLAEMLAPIFGVAGAPSPYALPVTPSVAGGIGTEVASSGATGTATPTAAPHKPLKVKVTLGGTLGTAKVRVSYDGGTTYGAEQTTAAGWASTGYFVPGTFTTIKLSAATYVLNDFATAGTDGTIVDFASAGHLTFVASPLDNYDLKATCVTGGGTGTATLQISLDNGRTNYGPPLLIPSGGTVAIPGIGVKLACSGTFTAGETHYWPCAAPGPSSSDITTALTAMLADKSSPNAGIIVLGPLAASAASAFTLAATLQASLDTAFTSYNKDYQAIMTCPLAGDIIVSGGTTQTDTADTRTVVKAARVGTNTTRVAVFYGTDYVQSAVGAYQVRRSRSTTFAQRLAAKLPVESDSSTVATRDQPISGVTIGDDEAYASVSLYDVQLNGYQTVQGYNGAFLAIGRGQYGFQNCTTDANLVDADGLRAINAILAGFRPVAARLIGRRYPINSDGTLEDKTRLALSDNLDRAIKKKAGIGPGADFGGVAQVSSITASVNPATNLGASGDKVIKVTVSVLPFGFASAVDITLYFQGAA